jgi:hypothetical protein
LPSIMTNKIRGIKISTSFKMDLILFGMRQQNPLRRNCFWGRELNHPLQLQWKLSCEGHSSAREMKEIWRDAMLSLREAKRKVAARYNADRRPHSFQVGDRVLVRLFPQSSAKNKISAKLLYKWSKPVVISKFLSPVTVELSFLHSGIRYRKAHISHLKLSNTQQDVE